MNKVLMVAMAFCISTTVATVAMSADKPAATATEKAAAAEKAAKKAAEIKWSGAVVSVDAATTTVVAKNTKGEMTFDVSAATFDKGVQLDTLKAGDRVTLKYEVKDGKNVVNSAKAKHAKARKSKPETTGEYVDDSVITTKVKAALLEDSVLKGFQINVKTYKNVVQLSGFVDTAASVTNAGEIAGRISGVKEVKNDLIVKK